MDAVVVANAALRDELFTADSADERMEAGMTTKMCHQPSLLFEQSTALATPVNTVASFHYLQTYNSICSKRNFENLINHIFP